MGRAHEHLLAGYVADFSAFLVAASVATFFSRHSASCLVRRAFCFLRLGASWGVDMMGAPYSTFGASDDRLLGTQIDSDALRALIPRSPDHPAVA